MLKKRENELEVRKEVEAIGKEALETDWNTKDSLFTAFPELNDAKTGLEKRLEYWEEFLKSDMYEGYWKSWREKGKYYNWKFHLGDLMYFFFVFIRGKKKGVN